MSDPSNLFDSRLTLLDGRAIGWAEYGDPAGYPVFFFHGWPGSRYQGARLDVAAWVVGARVIAPERPGYGLSDFRPGWTMLDWPEDVSQLADVLGLERFAVFGASAGGPFALACAARIPERVSSVAVASGLGPFDAPGSSQATSRMRSALLAANRRTRVPLSLGLRIVARRALADPDAILDWTMQRLPPCDRAIISQPDIRAIAVRDISAAIQDGGRAAAWEARLLTRPWGFQLANIQPHIHLWYGGMDPLIPPRTGHYLAQAIPNASAHYLPNDGHYLMIPRAVEILGTLSDQ